MCMHIVTVDKEIMNRILVFIGVLFVIIVDVTHMPEYARSRSTGGATSQCWCLQLAIPGRLSGQGAWMGSSVVLLGQTP